MTFNKIILTGDSAGGFLTVSTTVLAILNNVRIPDGIMPVYPAIGTNLGDFVPSSLCALDDWVLSSGFLSYCMSSFIAYKVNSSTNFLVNLSLTPDAVLLKFPRCHIYVCEADPLRDHAIIFGLRLHKLNKEVKINFMQDYIHGFLSLDLKINGVEEYHHSVGHATETLRHLMGGGIRK